jgi:hypothetical protein
MGSLGHRSAFAYLWVANIGVYFGQRISIENVTDYRVKQKQKNK